MEKKPIGIGIVGAGFGGKVQLPGFLGMPDAKVIGMAAKGDARFRDLADKHGFRAFASYQELIACEDVELVSVTTPPFAHEEIVNAVLDAGKHVLCEKPFTLSVSSGKKLLGRAKTANIVHGIDFEFRELPAMRALHEGIRKNLIGKVNSVDIRWTVRGWSDPSQPWRWQCDRSLGGGVLGAMGVHMFDASEWMFGKTKRVSAEVGTHIQERDDGQGGRKAVTSEDHGVVQMETADGIDVNVTLSNVDPDGKGLWISVHGEGGSLYLESESPDYGRGLSVRREDKNGASHAVHTDDVPEDVDGRLPPFQSLASRLLKAVRENDPSFTPSFQEGVRAQMIREAAIRSSDTGSRVDIA